ncbi:MAG: glycosyltransferase family 2 protein [Candidatus Omnitrophica bacterium]|nr:glycosyltransferase family 2 protein [Candidatus Omnitrophota bacterium]
MLISIVLPVYNQADHIQQVIEEYMFSLRNLTVPYEAILVVNGSKDRSMEVCLELAEKYPVVRVVESPKAGWGAAVRFGIAQAKGEQICYTNTARTRGKDLLLFLLYGMAHQDTVIKANRRIRDGIRRRIGSLFYNLEGRMLFDLYNWDINGTPKVFQRRWTALLEMKSEDDLIDLEFCVCCRENDLMVLEVPIFSTSRKSGRSTTGLFSALKLYWGAYKLWKSRYGKRDV